MADKPSYEKKLEAQLDEWKADIARLEAKARKAGADAQADYESEIKRLRKMQDDANEELKKLQNASSAAWEDVRKGAEQSMEAMQKAMRDAWSRFG